LPARSRAWPLYSLETFNATLRVRCVRLHAAIRDLYEQHPHDARPRRHPAACARSGRWRNPLVIAGGPCAQNPEPLAPFIDLFVSGDGEPALPLVCDEWLRLKEECRGAGATASGRGGQRQREEMLARMAATLPFAYVPRFYEPEFYADGRLATLNRTALRCPRDDRAFDHRRLRGDAAADRADRALCRMRSRSDRDRNHARLPLAMPFLPKHSYQAAATGARGRDDRQGRRSRPITTRASTRFRSCRFRPAIIRISEPLIRANAGSVSAARREYIAVPSLRVNEILKKRRRADRHRPAFPA